MANGKFQQFICHLLFAIAFRLVQSGHWFSRGATIIASERGLPGGRKRL
jgi:hypothetical protein